VQDIVQLLKQPASLITVFVPTDYTCVKVILVKYSNRPTGVIMNGRYLDAL